MDYSKTVNLPKTPFPMKADLPNREPGFQKFWEDIDLYHKLATRETPLSPPFARGEAEGLPPLQRGEAEGLPPLRRGGKGGFVLHDGPPYSNGDIHIGHALNKSLKDFVTRYKAMTGHRTPYVPGWDNHGMPIENKVMEGFRKKHESPERLAIRHACRDYAAQWVDTQREQFKRLGIMGEWDDPYLTMSREYEAAIIKVFGELAEQGYVYRGLKPIHWCIFDETALAEAEIEYDDHKSPSIYVRFSLVKDPKGLFGDGAASFDKLRMKGKKCYTVIWTTTPWTIPANLAVAVHPEYEYAFVDAGDDRYLLASELVARTMAAAGVQSYCVASTIRGSELEGMVFKHPIFDRDSVLVHAHYVTLDEGTGVVHTAPGHGREDFETGQRYGLDALCPVDGKGRFTKEAGQFEGLHITKQGNAAVLDALREAGHLLAESEVLHSYPHCWRCRNPLIFRTTVQWFMALDHNNLRRRMLDSLDSIQFFPAEARNRLQAMLENSPDWCLSRQRSWGVGIPVFFCADCGEPLMTRESINAVYEDALANGSDSWFEKDPAELLPAGTKCAKCGNGKFTKETDVMDVWFDSGSSSRAVLEGHWNLGYPADMYLEGSDQHRGWFNKSLVVGIATKNESPFRQLVSHGWVMDSDGRKMSKSLGNVVSPLQVIKEVGADVLRLFVSSSDYSEDVRMGDEIVTRITDAYRRVRNTFRFILGNLSDFDPAKDSVDYAEMEELDRYALHQLQELISQVTRAYESYEFHRIYHAVHEYCAVGLSSLYLDILKDRLYTSASDSRARRSAQTALHAILSALVRLVAPILVHTAEEVWQEMPGADKTESVHLAEFPKGRCEWTDDELAARWAKILEVRDKVLLRLEEARQSGKIGKPLASRVELTLDGKSYEFLKPYESILPAVFIVSQVDLREGTDEQIEVSMPAGEKCDRCWLVLESVGSHTEHPTLCDRCVDAVTQGARSSG